MKKSTVYLVTFLVFLFVSVYSYNTFLSQNEQSPSESLLLNAELSIDSIDFIKDAKPIFDKRCVVCHACYDAPCQLKNGSIEGIHRGANKDRVYDGERLIAANLTRLFQDAHSVEAWREKSFFPVVSDQPNDSHSNLQSSVMARMLAMKENKPLPENKLLPEEFELDLNRDYQCPTSEEFDQYEADYPLWGMPYALPALNDEESKTLLSWIAQGAKGSDSYTISASDKESITQWENYFNGDSLKQRLISRYLFEHLFLVNLYFESPDSQGAQFYRLVRSATPSGKDVSPIYTRRPFDDPEVDRVYYRIIPVKETLVHKSHMPLQLSTERKTRWMSWFNEPEYAVNTLPSYKPEVASNPFITFADIPIKSRYRYMIDEAQNTIMQFIKGPVCRGNMALNVINDHFWVVFADPEADFVEHNNQFMRETRDEIGLPAADESNAMPVNWLAYAKKERDYLKSKSEFIETKQIPLSLETLWDGDGNNDNLALSIFRHNDAATVVKGLVGEKPQTMWVLTYPLFERIHYLLVAGYDVYGNLGHQLNSRMYMDFLRMEGEFNFLSMLPKQTQEEVRKNWYRGSVSEVEEFVYNANTARPDTVIEYETNDPLNELYEKIRLWIDDKHSELHLLKSEKLSASSMSTLMSINSLSGKGLSYLPQTTLILISNDQQEKELYTLIKHNAYTNISHLFKEAERRLPDEDTVTLAKGLVTSHPNAFMTLEESEIDEFTNRVAQMQSEQDFSALMDNFGVRRSHPKFWTYADQIHENLSEYYPIEASYLDFNRLENR